MIEYSVFLMTNYLKPEDGPKLTPRTKFVRFGILTSFQSTLLLTTLATAVVW